MTYFKVDPEVAGGLGEGTEMDDSTHPPTVRRLHFQIEGWMGDDLVQSFPCFLVTARLRELLLSLNPSGICFADAVVTVSEELLERDPSATLPKLVWLRVTGIAGVDDFGLTSDASLVVSDRILQAMRSLQLLHCEVEPFTGSTHGPKRQ